MTLFCSFLWLSVSYSLSRVRLFATPQTVAHQAPLSMGFSRQEYWSGLPFPSPNGRVVFHYIYIYIYIYIQHFLYPSICDRLLGRFWVLSIVNSAVMNIVSMYLFELWFFPGIFPGVEFLGHMVILLLFFWGTSILFSIVAIPTYVPTNRVGESPFLCTLSCIYYLQTF